MGSVHKLPRGTHSGLFDLHVLIRRDMLRRVEDAAAALEQNRSAWVRMAIVEKLERDGK